ncbi:MAG: Smr/MutS family protein [Gammaproteobacteria bacterium]
MADKDENEALFRKAVSDAVPLAQRPKAPRGPRPKPRARMREADEHSALAETLDDPRHPDEFGAEPDLAYAAPGVQRRVLVRLRRGQIPVRAVLDLHGMTLPMARREFALFLADALAREFVCVRIIHGKGYRSGPRGPVLKRAVARWLAHRREVLAYTSARPVDGGTGAVYVLLRRGG